MNNDNDRKIKVMIIFVFILFTIFPQNLFADYSEIIVDRTVNPYAGAGVNYGVENIIGIKLILGIEFFNFLYITGNFTPPVIGGMSGGVGIGLRCFFLFIENNIIWSVLYRDDQNIYYHSMNPYIGICIPNLIFIDNASLELIPYFKIGPSFFYGNRLENNPLIKILDRKWNIECGVNFKFH